MFPTLPSVTLTSDAPSWDELKALTKEWYGMGELPDPDLLSSLAFRRFRHDFTNYDDLMDEAEDRLWVCRDVIALARSIYPQLSFRATRGYLRNKRNQMKYLTSLEDGVQ